MAKLLFLLTAIFFIFLFLLNITINVANAQKGQLKVSSSSVPQNFNRYLFNKPLIGLEVVSSSKGCFNSANVSHEGAQSDMQPQLSSYLTTKVKLNVSGSKEMLQSSVPVDMVIAIDSSGSMEQNDRNNLRLIAAKELINKTDFTRGDKLALVMFDDDIEYASPLVSDSSLIRTQIDSIDSSGDTNLDIGLNSSISILDKSTRVGPSSKAIIFLSDGEEKYTTSGNVGSLTDRAKANGYKIFSVGLNVGRGSSEERHLTDMANTTGGSYYFQPSKYNIQDLFKRILQTSIKHMSPANIDVQTVMQSYFVIDKNSFNIQPSSIRKNQDNETILRWENISKYVGNQDDMLSQNETFAATFSAELPLNMTAYPRIRLPLFVDGESVIKYIDSSGNVNVTSVPPIYISVNFIGCPEIPPKEKEPLKILFGTFIVPRSSNASEIDTIQQPKSNIFKPNETIEFYVEAAGVTKKRIMDESTGRTHYLSYTTTDFTITDEQGNLKSPNYISSFPLVKITNSTLSNSSHTFRYEPNFSPPLEPGIYVLNFTITDNFSGETVTIPKTIAIEDFHIIRSALISPGSTINRQFGQYEQYSSNMFLPNDTIEFYVEFAGMTPRLTNELGKTPYMVNVSGVFEISDDQGTVKAQSIPGEAFHPFHVEFNPTRTSSSSFVFGFEPGFPPPLEPGNYIINSTIVDNVSKRKIDSKQNIVIINSKNSS